MRNKIGPATSVGRPKTTFGIRIRMQEVLSVTPIALMLLGMKWYNIVVGLVVLRL